MNDDSFEKYLKQWYEKPIDWYDRKAIAKQRWYRRFRSSVIVFSAVTPVLIELKIDVG